MRRPRVEILYFEGCPNHEQAQRLVEQVATELELEPQIALVEVADDEAAARLRFLGSPSVRVEGRDVEPGADERGEFVLSCRIYRNEHGFTGQPDAQWIRTALLEASANEQPEKANGAQLPRRVAEALSAAEIPPWKQGPARRARLTAPERELYFWILRRFTAGGRPGRTELRGQAARLGLDFEQALATLRREDLVHRDGLGEITVAYPFSGVPTAHRVRFAGGQEAFAMCAIDALGIAPMFDQPIAISSRDPLSGEEFHARLAPDGTGSWQPESAAVVAGVSDRQADSCFGCCPVLNFFASNENAERWLRERPQVRGRVISIEDAIASGRAVFGGVFGEQ